MENIVALITPFKDGNVSYEGLKSLVLKHIREKTDKLLLLGTTSEAPSLSLEEKKKIVKEVALISEGKIELIGSLCVNNLNSMKEELKVYDGINIKSFLVITPYYNKSTKKGIIEYFMEASKIINKDIIIYDVKSRTNYDLTIEEIKKLMKIKHVKGIKLASSDLTKIRKVCSLNSPDFKVYCGDDLVLMDFLLYGTSGVISVMSNVISEIIKNIIESYNKGEHKASLELFRKYEPLMEKCLGVLNPVGIKALMNALNLPAGDLRLPLKEETGLEEELYALWS